MMLTSHEKYMHRCLDLAGKGIQNVSPNPMVGALIVYNNKIVGEGYHKKYGEPHAEVNAINSVNDKSILKKSKIYVSLEPCSHYGKTPPCTDLIIKEGIPEIIVGSTDPNPKVAGKGISKLINAGRKVLTGVLDKECINLNKRFYTFHTKKRPYIILKWAKTKDGFIDIHSSEKGKWITNKYCKSLVHKWRTEDDAFLVGENTAVKDNPQLTSREWPGKNPVRLLFDPDLNVPKSHKIFDSQAKTYVFNSGFSEDNNNITYVKINFNENPLSDILDFLYNEKIMSVVIEGGAYTLNKFISKNLWDEARVFIGNKYFTDGIKAPEFDFPVLDKYYYGDSELIIYKNKNNEFFHSYK